MIASTPSGRVRLTILSNLRLRSDVRSLDSLRRILLLSSSGPAVFHQFDESVGLFLEQHVSDVLYVHEFWTLMELGPCPCATA